MVAIKSAIVLFGLISLVAGRRVPYSHRNTRMIMKRQGLQGTLTASTDPTDFGKCSLPEIIGSLGLDGRTEFAFQPFDKTSYPHTSAQNIAIITQFMCDTMVNTCGASVAAHDLCTKTEAEIGAGKNDGSLADRWNAAFNIQTDFAAAPGSVSSAGVTVAGSAPASTTAAAVAASTTEAASATSSAAEDVVTVTVTAPCESATDVASVTTSSAAVATAVAAASSSTLDFGSCSNPEILFENGLDGRNTPAFIAANQGDFNHGSALNIDVITGFIVQRLGSPCNAPQSTIDIANTAAAAATAEGGKDGGAADIWNKAFGISTTFATATGNA